MFTKTKINRKIALVLALCLLSTMLMVSMAIPVSARVGAYATATNAYASVSHPNAYVRAKISGSPGHSTHDNAKYGNGFTEAEVYCGSSGQHINSFGSGWEGNYEKYWAYWSK